MVKSTRRRKYSDSHSGDAPETHIDTDDTGTTGCAYRPAAMQHVILSCSSDAAIIDIRMDGIDETLKT